MQISSAEKLYICPGETHPITRSVHLSRLAAFYPACRDCPFRTETGQLRKQTVERLQSTERRVERKSLFTAEGVRGVYLNELNRSKADAMATALAGLLWDASPPAGRSDSAKQGSRRARPAVVVGYDERPSSPDIVTGVVGGLRRMGCQVIDIGLTTRPCFWFTVDHLQATAGIHVTGAGCGPAWTGLDFVGRGGQPLSRNAPQQVARDEPGHLVPIIASLDLLERRLREATSRPTRQAGPRRPFQAFVPYEAGLWKHFHALRPLTVCYACPTPLVRRTLEHLFAALPCKSISVGIPNRVRNTADSQDTDVARLGEAVRHEGADLGVLIDDDGQRCGFFDERGTLLSPRHVSRTIVDLLLMEHPRGTIVVEETAVEDLQPSIAAAGGRCIAAGSTATELSQAMRDHEAIFCAGDTGRYWFREAFPTCDALLTLARVLQVLSRSDRPCSEVVRGSATPTVARD